MCELSNIAESEPLTTLYTFLPPDVVPAAFVLLSSHNCNACEPDYIWNVQFPGLTCAL